MARRLYRAPGKGVEMTPIDGVRALAALAETNPRKVARVAALSHPSAMDFATELDALCNKYSRLGLGRTAAIIMLAAAAGHATGDGVDQDKATAGEAAELMTDVACLVLRSAADAGYMLRAKERKNARG